MPSLRELIIEPAHADDVESMLTIKCAAWLTHYVSEEWSVTRADIEAKIADASLPASVLRWQYNVESEGLSGASASFVARLGEKVVGYTAPRIEEYTGRRRVGAMYVDQPVRGWGVGGNLLQKGIAWHGRENPIFLECISYNYAAMGFYGHFGFTKNGVFIPGNFDKERGIKMLPKIEMVLPAK